ncbi:hypothetical protein CHS0354_028490 [Potamilus streckersoni]|uniref:Tetratricopeptide repeat protein 38 n=1 Tax=Potamilus streckersoni TaxID=2493646 RepID=A0AAE0VQA7_9BIVA|nr:hypothetical protein CHS0354_028490 [Potamilus streckersoni]
MHQAWRDSQAWTKFGTPLSTNSNEACKLFDATLTQYIGWYDDPSMCGMGNCCDGMLKADPDFVMGHVLKNGLNVLGTGRTTRLDPDFSRDIQNMEDLASRQKLTPREHKHVEAVKLWADGEMAKACDIWESILLYNPLDILALKFAHDSYFFLGFSSQMRDSIGRILPHWKPDMPLYGYLLGMHSFGLEETNFYPEAEETAKKGLEINRHDAWSTHTVAHVMEMTGRQDEGIRFMSGTENDWAKCGMLACHNYWHWCLYNIEKGNHEEALGIVDSQILPRAKASGAMLDNVDACSVLYRLEMEGVNVKDRWQDLYEICRSHTDDHVLVFNDIHILMAMLGVEDKTVTRKMMDSIRDFIKAGKGDNRDITASVGLPICEALIAYDDGDYAKATELMYPLRYKVVTIGGSHAQRDLYNQFLIHAALKSPKKEHNKLARHLLMERKALKPCAPLTDRLIERAMAVHIE